MSDPSSVQEPAPPPQPPRPVQSPRLHEAGRGSQSQLEADELYARQLAEHYNRPADYGDRTRGTSYNTRSHAPHLARPKKETGLKPNELYDDREHSFLDGLSNPLSYMWTSLTPVQTTYPSFETTSGKVSSRPSQRSIVLSPISRRR